MTKSECFSLGCFTGALLVGLVIIVFSPPPVNSNVRPEAVLTTNCLRGERVLITTPTPNEFYECETHWVRR